jgi:hypothetical protein
MTTRQVSADTPLSLWLLVKTSKPEDFDEMYACVVAAANEVAARTEASQWYGTEDAPTWEDAEWSDCTRLGVADPGVPAGMVVRDLRRGPGDGKRYRPDGSTGLAAQRP